MKEEGYEEINPEEAYGESNEIYLEDKRTYRIESMKIEQ